MIKKGYLALATYPDQTGVVQLLSSDDNPQDKLLEKGGRVRFVQKFYDIEAAFMQAQSMMSKQMLDLNQNLYKRPLARAMGDLESLELDHEVIWQDPQLSETELQEMQKELDNQKLWQSRRDKAIQVIKWLAILYIVFNLLAPIL